ncbi:MAG: allantoinase PuuE [Alphaproteobacteria bacterium]|nr:allantoinase PuuE [Alphaproteobacteria bacterium]
MNENYPRDLIGYGATPPTVRWPGEARIAVNFVINYEEGGENCLLHGDRASEAALSDLFMAQPMIGQRNYNMEQAYEYGSRVGIWRLLRIFDERKLPFTVYAVGMAMERHPEAARAMARLNCDFVSHGWRWFDYQDMDEATERQHIKMSFDVIQRLTGQRARGYYCGRPSWNTRRLAVAEGALYDCDSYSDELPYWVTVEGKPHLVVPHTLDNNDTRYARGQGWVVPDDFYECLKADFDELYREGERQPRMMTVALHCRLAGKPGRAAAFAKFVDYVLAHTKVWICKRDEIAEHWTRHHAPG